MKIIEIAKIIEKEGGRLYLVGGAIRDKFLKKESYDEDYCVTGISYQKFIELFPNCHIRGKSFEVFELEGKEFALARTETKTGKGHKEFNIQTGKDITIEQDLQRRDITINSIAQDVLAGNIIDPFNGIEDIKYKKIKATSKSFTEDPLRVYRVARIASQLKFNVEKNTINLMRKLKDELKFLPKERVFVEFRKALETDKPSIFFNVLKKANVLNVHFKPIYKLIGALQPEEYHPEGDSYNHTMICLDKSTKMTNQLEIRYSVLVHDLGKGKTPKEEYPHHYNHEIRGIEVVKELSNNLGVPNAWKKCGITSCAEHMRGGIFYKMTPKKKVEFIERISKTYLGLKGLQIVVNCDKLGNNNLDKQKYNFEEIGKQCLEEINAKSVMEKYKLTEGIQLGNKLHQERIEWMKKRGNI